MNNQPSLILIHGGGMSGWIWKKHVADLSDFHCIIPDLPWHGRSQGLTPFSIKESTRFIETIIRTRAHGGKAHVFGLSLGAQIAIELLVKAPEVVETCMISGSIIFPKKGMMFKNWVTKLYMPLKNNKFMLKARMRSMNIPEEYCKYFQNETAQLTETHFMQVMKEHSSYKAPSGLYKVRVPTLILVGENDSRLNYRCARELEYFLPRGMAYVVSNSTYNWMIKESNKFSRVVRSWTKKEMLPDEFNPLI